MGLWEFYIAMLELDRVDVFEITKLLKEWKNLRIFW